MLTLGVDHLLGESEVHLFGQEVASNLESSCSICMISQRTYQLIVRFHQ